MNYTNILPEHQLLLNMLSLIFWILAFAVAITIHEASHAFMADKLGDPTARLMGRLTLNPIKHYDRVGTTLLLVLVFLRGLSSIPGFEGFRYIIPFGWAKPVEIDPYNLKNPRKDSALISLAGPGANLLLAVIISLIARFSPLLALFATPFIVLNVSLAIFNLIPVNPLDGGKILLGVLPKRMALDAERFLNSYGVIILFLLIFPVFGGTSLISSVISPIINFFLRVLLPQVPLS